MSTAEKRRSELYGGLVFAAVVLVVYADMLRPNRLTDGEPWQVVVIFVLGAVYCTLGLFGLDTCAPRPARTIALYFSTQCTLVTAIILLSPVKGFFAIVAMPILSMAVLELGWFWATLVVIELWATCIGAVWIAYGFDTVLQSSASYATPFVFTIVFSILTRKAFAARAHAEKLSGELAEANELLRLHAEQAGEIATTRERNRVAREIHDGIGHYLTTINVQLEAARAVFSTSPAQAASAMERAARLASEALDDVRRSVGVLRADVPRPPLPELLQSLADNLALPVTIRVAGDPRPLPPAVEQALYRSAQEGLTNVTRHAGAAHTELTLDFRNPGRVALTIADDGRGASFQAEPAGYGLRGIRERVELLGGMLTTGNRREGGFQLCVDVPA